MKSFRLILLVFTIAALAAFTCACNVNTDTTTEEPTEKPTETSGEPYTVIKNKDGSKTVNSVTIPKISVPAADFSDTTSAKNTDVTFPDHNVGSKNTNADFISACHIWSNEAYSLDGNDSLYSGCLRMLQLGSKSIKLYLTNYYAANYSDVNWAKEYDSPLALAAGEEFSRVFDMDFNTFVIGVYIFGSHQGSNSAIYWAQGLSETDRKLEYQQLYDLTYYLCKRYAGTGKTFIIQNWETDWSCLPAANRTEANPYPSDESLANCVKWINTRQDAIMAARNDAACEGVYVYQALEVNRVLDGMQGNNSVITNVVPYTYCDFYSYSSYDGAGTDENFSAALDFMLEKVASNRTGGKSLCFIGEFGWPDYLGKTESLRTAERVVTISREKGFSHAFYWQLFDKDEGMFLVNDQGQYHVNWNYFYKYIHGTDDPNYLAQLENSRLNYPLYWEPTGKLTENRNGLKVKDDSYDGGINIVEYAGRWCAESGAQAGHSFIYFNADEQLTSDIRNITVRVTYYDDVSDQLSIQYNGVGGNPANNKSVKVNGTGEWIVVDFVLTDAAFDDLLHQGIADFRLAGSNSRVIRVARVEIYLTDEME